MSADAWATLAILVVLFALLIWDRWPAWAVFGGALTAVLTFDLAPEGDALKGFSNTGVLSVVVLFMVAAGVYATGAINLIVDRVVGQPKSEQSANTRILPAVAGGSAFLNNTPIVAMLVPVIEDLGRSARLAVSKIYMAVSNASILGGAATLIGTSTNLIIAGLVLDTTGEKVDIFFPTPVGVPAALVGVAFLIFVAGRMLKGTAPSGEVAAERRIYRAEFRIPSGSRLRGLTLEEAGLANPAGARLAAVIREGEPIEEAGGATRLQVDDVIAVEGDIDAIPALWTTIGLEANVNPTDAGSVPTDSLVQVVVSRRNGAIDHRVADLPPDSVLREARIIAMSRAARPMDSELRDVVIKRGDSAILQVPDEFLATHHEMEFALMRRLRGYRVQRVDRAYVAGAIVVGMIVLAATGLLSLLNAALLATGVLLLTGCITFRNALRSINWETYVVLACAVGLEPAVTHSGLADEIADVMAFAAGDTRIVALAVVFLGAVLMTNVITNAAAAAFMFPIAMSMADSMEANWEPFIVALMLGASYAFLNPAGYQTHLMVYEPGGYRFVDFVRVGLPLTLLVGIVVVGLTPLVYRF